MGRTTHEPGLRRPVRPPHHKRPEQTHRHTGPGRHCRGRDGLGHARTDLLNRIHKLLLELLPGGAKKFLSAGQARAMLNTIRPRDLVGRTRRRLTSELISELVGLDRKIKAANKELTELVASTGSSRQDLNGIGPSGAARLIGDVGDIHRFASRSHFASWNGTAPLDASSSDQQRHRLSRAGNRRINRVLHIMAVVQLRHDTPGRAHHRRRIAEGKTPMEAIRALKRRPSTWSTGGCSATRRAPQGRAREDKRGRLCNPARLTQTPRSTLRNSHFPDPPSLSLEHNIPTPLDKEGSQLSARLSPEARRGTPDASALIHTLTRARSAAK